MEGNG